MGNTITKLQKFSENYYLVESSEVLVERKLNVVYLKESDDLLDVILNSESEEINKKPMEYSETYYAIYEQKSNELIKSEINYDDLEKFINQL